MAKALIGGGHRVTVWNRSTGQSEALRRDGAIIASSPGDAASAAEFVISMVRDDIASRAVWLERGALAALSPGAMAIESSTISTAWAGEFARLANARQVSLLDAPVVGSRPQADQRQLIFLVGGGAEDVLRATPVLQAMGGAIHHVGPAGAGVAVKLAVNALFAVQVAALAELIGALGRSGIDLGRAVDAIAATPACSIGAKGAAASMLANRFEPLFPVELVEKDLRYAQALAEGVNATLPLSDSAREVMSTAIARNFGADHLTGVIRLYLDRVP
jgi:3-hydroxyisobutyrate dehydrogenase